MDRQLSYVENRLVCGIKLANWKVHESATKDPRCKGMGTTMVTAMLNGDRAYFGWVGDSRGYRLRNGAMKQMTRDHSLLEDYKEAKPDMTEEEQRNFPHKNVITAPSGCGRRCKVDIRPEAIEIGDTFMLCCDGLTGMIDDARIGEIIKNADEDLESALPTWSIRRTRTAASITSRSSFCEPTKTRSTRKSPRSSTRKELGPTLRSPLSLPAKFFCRQDWLAVIRSHSCWVDLHMTSM